MERYQHIREKLEPLKVYTYREIVNIISPTQSTTAEYIMDNMRACGMLSYASDSTGHTGFKLVQ